MIDTLLVDPFSPQLLHINRLLTPILVHFFWALFMVATMGSSSSFLVLSLFVLSFCLTCNADQITSDARGIMINGERKILISGSVHYPRSTPEVQVLNCHTIFSNTCCLFYSMSRIIGLLNDFRCGQIWSRSPRMEGSTQLTPMFSGICMSLNAVRLLFLSGYSILFI